MRIPVALFLLLFAGAARADVFRILDDPRDAMCMAEDEELAQELLASIDLHLQNAWKIHGNGRPARREEYPLVSRAKVFRVWAARFLLPIVENQL